jgi:hypothetical protein
VREVRRGRCGEGGAVREVRDKKRDCPSVGEQVHVIDSNKCRQLVSNVQ